MNFLFYHIVVQFINNLLFLIFIFILYLTKIGTASLGIQSQYLLILNQQHFLALVPVPLDCDVKAWS